MSDISDRIDMKKSMFGDENDDGTLIDYDENIENEEINDVKDDDAPLINPFVNEVLPVFCSVYTSVYRDIISEWFREGLQFLLPEQYENGMNRHEYLEKVGSNHLGSINSALSVGVSEKISQILKKDGFSYISRDGDKIDWEIKGSITVCGDNKMAIASKIELGCFTGNGSSNKEGLYWLNAIKLDDEVPMKNTIVTHMYGGLIPVKYVSNLRAKGKSDRSSIKIKTSLQHRLYTMFGGTRPCLQWLKFNLHPIYDINNKGFFSKETE
jgi:hypothetical protein